MPASELQRYPAEVFWSDEDEGFIAVARDLPGCSAWGVDEADAVRELRDAIAAWVEAATAAGNPIPVPSRPAEEVFSGKLMVRMPRSLHGDLARGARAQGVSLNQHVCYLLTEAVTAKRLVQSGTAPIVIAVTFVASSAVVSPARSMAGATVQSSSGEFVTKSGAGSFLDNVKAGGVLVN